MGSNINVDAFHMEELATCSNGWVAWLTWCWGTVSECKNGLTCTCTTVGDFMLHWSAVVVRVSPPPSPPWAKNKLKAGSKCRADMSGIWIWYSNLRLSMKPHVNVCEDIISQKVEWLAMSYTLHACVSRSTLRAVITTQNNKMGTHWKLSINGGWV